MGVRLNSIIQEANEMSLKLHADMERSTVIHECAVAIRFEEQSRIDELVVRQNTMKAESDVLIASLEEESNKIHGGLGRPLTARGRSNGRAAKGH